MAFSIKELCAQYQGTQYDLHEQYLNRQMVKVLRTIGYDKWYHKAIGQYLYDQDNQQYLDLLSGFGVFAIGRNHPTVIQALQDAMTLELPNLVQMDVSLLSGLLAKELLETLPEHLSRMFFCNSGTEAVEAAIKFARYATKRSRILYCENGYHGLTLGALSLCGDDIFRKGFGPLLPDCVAVPFNSVTALEQALAQRDIAAFIIEPIQGKGVILPDEGYLQEVERLCKKYGTLLVVDEVQTGIGRTGKFWAIDHWQIQPDMILMAKALSGGFVPIGGVAMTQEIMDAVFSRMDRAVVHGSTFAKNNLAMAAGLATLAVIKNEQLVSNSARIGEEIIQAINAHQSQFEFLKEARGKGMMIAIEFQAPKSLTLKTAWTFMEAAQKGLFSQMVAIPLLQNHRVLSQVAGHGLNVIKLLPPLNLNNQDRDWTISALQQTIQDLHKIGTSVWTLGKTLAKNAVSAKQN